MPEVKIHGKLQINIHSPVLIAKLRYFQRLDYYLDFQGNILIIPC